MKKVNFVILFLVFANFISAQNSYFDWAKPIGGIYDEYGASLIIGKNGDVYTTGTFQGTVDFSPSPNTNTLVSLGGFDVYVTKHNSAGILIWAKNFGSTLNESVSSIKTDTIGNIYITGSFRATCDFDPGPSIFSLTPIGNSDVFIVKLDTSGNFVWAKQFGGLGNDESSGIAISIGGDIHITGYFNGTVDFDPGPSSFNLTADGINDIFVLKLNSYGNLLWAQKLIGVSKSIDIDNNNNVFIVGGFKETVDFDPGPLTFNLSSAGFQDVFILKFNSSGNFVWVKQFEGGVNDDEECRSIKVDNSGDICITGSYGFTIDFDPGPGVFNLTSVGMQDVYVVKLSNNGNFIWAKSFGSLGGNDIGNSINIDNQNNLYCGGKFFHNVDFDPGPGTYTLNASNLGDGFITKLGSNGNFIYAISISGVDQQVVSSISIDTLNNVYATGFFESLTDFDPGLAVYSYSATNRDAFVLKLSTCTNPNNANNTTPASNQFICTGNTTTLTATAPTGTLSWFATPTSTSVIGTGTTFVTPVLSTGTYTYYVEVETCTTSISRTAITVTVSSCVGVNEFAQISKDAVIVCPNPSNGYFNIQSAINGNFVISDVVGKSVMNGELRNGLSQLNFENEPNGIYFLRVTSNQGNTTIKLIKN